MKISPLHLSIIIIKRANIITVCIHNTDSNDSRDSLNLDARGVKCIDCALLLMNNFVFFFQIFKI